jgi:hypothetical protein
VARRIAQSAYSPRCWSTRSSAACGDPRHSRSPKMASIASSVGLIRLSRSQTSLAFRASGVRNSILTEKRPQCGLATFPLMASRTAACQSRRRCRRVPGRHDDDIYYQQHSNDTIPMVHERPTEGTTWQAICWPSMASYQRPCPTVLCMSRRRVEYQGDLVPFLASVFFGFAINILTQIFHDLGR